MQLKESMVVIALLSEYKRRWIRYRISETLNRKSPFSMRETIKTWVEEVANEGFEPVFEALESGQDVLAALREALKAVASPDGHPK